MTTGVTQTLFAQALARLTGLTYTASLAWASAEVGPLNNLGIMASGHPAAYPTPAAGAAAAAALIASSSYYAGIRASVGGTAQAQMDAIARSPWHLGPTGLASAGGVDPYYAKVFSSFGYTPGASATPAPVLASSTTPAGSSALGTTVADLFPALSPTSLFTAAEVETLIGDLTVKSPTDPIIATQRTYLSSYIGQPINQIPTHGLKFGGQLIGLGLPDLTAIFGNFAWVPQVLIGGSVLGLVLVLAYSGVEDLLG